MDRMRVQKIQSDSARIRWNSRVPSIPIADGGWRRAQALVRRSGVAKRRVARRRATRRRVVMKERERERVTEDRGGDSVSFVWRLCRGQPLLFRSSWLPSSRTLSGINRHWHNTAHLSASPLPTNSRLGWNASSIQRLLARMLPASFVEDWLCTECSHEQVRYFDGWQYRLSWARNNFCERDWERNFRKIQETRSHQCARWWIRNGKL